MSIFTVTPAIRMNNLFLDTSFAIALAAASDQHHRRALELSQQIQSSRVRLITTRAVILEIGNALSKQRHRAAAVVLLRAMATDPLIEIVPLTDALFARALELFEQRPDKEWGLTDCISFVVMNDQGITDALTADDHFRQAGFRPLLKDP